MAMYAAWQVTRNESYDACALPGLPETPRAVSRRSKYNMISTVTVRTPENGHRSSPWI